jgi:hypothetical protein
MRFTVLFRLVVGFVLWTMLAASAAGAGAKVHVFTFGEWTSAQWLPAGSTEGEKPLTMKVRALIVDGRSEDVVGSQQEKSPNVYWWCGARFE